MIFKQIALLQNDARGSCSKSVAHLAYALAAMLGYLVLGGLALSLLVNATLIVVLCVNYKRVKTCYGSSQPGMIYHYKNSKVYHEASCYLVKDQEGRASQLLPCQKCHR